jgi:NhaA family Na+:H+ antiporter
VLGLVIGKTIGVAGFSWLAVRLRVGALPEGSSWGSLVGVAMLAGIGFTVSIFIAGLAFEEKLGLQNEAKIGILVASIGAAAVGSLALTRRPR